MSVVIRILIAIVFVCYSGVSLAKKLSIDGCKQTKNGDIDCRRQGFQNVPYDVFKIPRRKIYLSGNPFICDCTMVWFLRESGANKRRIRDFRDMKCYPPGKSSMVAISKVKEKEICKTKLLRVKDFCEGYDIVWPQSTMWFNCKKSLTRIPHDIFEGNSKNTIEMGRRTISCDCDTVWFIRCIKNQKCKLQVKDRHLLFCAKGKKFSKPVKLNGVDEEDVCPQRETDHCRINPCPAKVTRCINDKHTTPPYKCFDVNECLKHPCPKPEICVNKQKTGYACQCPKELPRRDKITKECIPPDPCQDKSYPCPNTSKCETIRSPTEISHRCVDIDECLTGQFDCGPGEECFNKENGYACHCKSGLTRNSSNSCIVNVDPCKIKPPVCDLKTQQCITKGKIIYSYECQDIDECSTNKHDCHANAKCINTAPGYKCKCNHGFKEYDNGRQCKDLNECSEKSRCVKNAKCINIPGSFKCKCNAGYFGDGKHNCKDKNECSSHSHCSIDAECKNIPGSYECACKKGYLGNGRICKDIDECSLEDKYDCPDHSECENTPGSYMCKCLDGFKLKKDRCLDVDECKSNIHTCHKNAVCKNFVGSYKCRCKEGYEHLKSGRVCLKKVTTQDNSMFVVLIAVPVCLLFVFSLPLVLHCQRKYRKKQTQNSEEDESKLLLQKQYFDDVQQQAVYFFDPRANIAATN